MPRSHEIPLPALPADTHGIPKGKRYVRQFGVIAIVPDEASQIRLFEELVGQGYRCKVVNT